MFVSDELHLVLPPHADCIHYQTVLQKTIVDSPPASALPATLRQQELNFLLQPSDKFPSVPGSLRQSIPATLPHTTAHKQLTPNLQQLQIPQAKTSFS